MPDFRSDGSKTIISSADIYPHRGCPAFLLNIAERSLPRLTLRGGSLASKDAVS
jgi:hypothetical protein